MRVKRNPHIEDAAELQMTPMIDIVFQLLIFFLLSAKFVALEGQLSSYLPKDRGTSTLQPPPLANASFFLEWEPEGSGRVKCVTIQYVDPETGNRHRQHTFDNLDPGQQVPFGPIEYGHKVYYKYSVPDFQQVEKYLKYRFDTFVDTQGMGKGLPVIVEFDDPVPVQMVMNLLDICKRVGVTDFTLAAKEQEIP